MALTKKNHYENELINGLKDGFKRYISCELFSFKLDVKKEYELKLKKLLNVNNILKLSQYPNNVIKLHLDGKVNLL
jgi:hypothetical protein